MTTVGELVAVLRADSAQFVASMEEAQAQVGALKAESTGFSKAASTAFIAAGAVAVIAIAKMVDATVEWARSVKGLQNTTGQTAESASALLVVGQQFGLSVTQMTTAFGIFEKNIVSGNKNIEKFGLVTRDAQGNLLPFDQLLSNAAETYGTLRTQVEKTAFAQLVFGRSGRALIPILKQGAAGLDALLTEAQKSNLVIGQGTVDAAINLGIAERKLGEALHGVAVGIGTEFLPVATKVIDWFVSLTEAAGRVSPVIPAVVLGFVALSGAGALLIRVGQGLVGAWASVFGAIAGSETEEAAATAATVTLTDAISSLVATLQAQAAAAAEAAGSTQALAAVDAEAAGASEALAGAQAGVVASAGAAEGAIAGGGGLIAAIGGIAAVAAPAIAILALLVIAVKVHADSIRANALVMTKSINVAVQSLAGIGPVTNLLRGVDTGLGRTGKNLIAFAIIFQNAVTAGQNAGKSFEDVAAMTQGSLLAAFKSGAISAKEFAQALQYTGMSAKDAQKYVRDAADNGKILTDNLSHLITPANFAATAIADIGASVDLLNAGIANAAPMFQKFADVSGQATDSILSDLQKVVNDGKSTPEQVQQAYVAALGQMRQANQAWHDSIVSTFGGAGSAMDQFANKHVVDINKAIGSLQDYTKQIHGFDGDIRAIHKRFGKDASDFIQWASQQGLAQAGLVHSVATSSKKDADTFIRQWKRSQDATDQLATDIQHALAPVFDKIIGWLKNVVHAIQGVPPINLKTQQAEAALRTLDNNISQLVNSKHTIDVGVHTHPTSPWPDEALKQHLTDPIQRAGFKKINGRWTLPLDVGVHSSLGPKGGGHGSLSPIGGGGNDPSSLAEMLMKQAGWKNNFQSVLDRVNAAGQSPNYIDRVTQKLADKLGPAAAKAFRSALTDLDVQSGRIDPRWMTQAFKNVSYIPEGHTNISTNHHHDNNNRGGGIRVIVDRRHMDQQASYQEDYGRGF